MSSVLLKTFYPEDSDEHRWLLGTYRLFRKSALQSKKHHLTDDAGEAAIILFCDEGMRSYMRPIFESACFKRYPEKCFTFVEGDFPLALLPGVYASIEKSWHDPRWTRSGFYVHIDNEDRFSLRPWQDEMPYLFSFVGSCGNAAVRKRLSAINDPRFHLSDTSRLAASAFASWDAAAIKQLNDTYTEVTQRSRFVLCPRGLGASSFRLFEVMSMGRAPVILSDEWVPPAGPDWPRFSITVPEADVLELPRILAPLADSAREMGRAARQQWERWFAPPALFDTTVDWCLDIQRAGKCGDRWFRRRKFLQLLRPFHARNYLRSLKNERGAP